MCYVLNIAGQDYYTVSDLREAFGHSLRIVINDVIGPSCICGVDLAKTAAVNNLIYKGPTQPMGGMLDGHSRHVSFV